MDIILASASPRRKELMALITKNFTCAAPQVDERAVTAATPQALVGELAKLKCLQVFSQHLNSLVIGCDTLVECGGEVLGKPATEQEAAHMLKTLSGRTHNVHTGIYIKTAAATSVFITSSTVTFNTLSDDEIQQYIKTDEPYDKAGGYGIQGPAAKFVHSVNGCYFNIMGLPVSAVYNALKQHGASF